MFKQTEHGLIISLKRSIVVDFGQFIQVNELSVDQLDFLAVISNSDAVTFPKLRPFKVD